jgi:hypothetical protein
MNHARHPTARTRVEGLLTQREFDHLLFAHGDPIIGGRKAALCVFVRRQNAG